MSDLKTTAIVAPVMHDKPEQVFDPIGNNLVSIFEKRAEQGQMLDHLWQLYLMDCNRHGVKPIQGKVPMPKLRAFTCNICPIMGVGVKTYKCQECGREVCNHANRYKPLCMDCGKPSRQNA